MIASMEAEKALEQVNSVKQQGFNRIPRLFGSSIEKIEPVFGKPVIYELQIDGVLFEIFAHLKENSPYLCIFNPAALNRSQYQPPRFPRWSWAVRCPYSAISLNDPTLYLHRSLTLGWFQGTESQYYMPMVCNIVVALANQLGIDAQNLLFSGSSAGGFASLMMAAHVRGSSAFVINPQTDLTQFAPRRIAHLLETSFSGISIQKARNLFLDRLSVIDYYRKISDIPKILYLQNTTDQHHLKKHYLPFIQEIGQIMIRDEASWKARLLIQSELYCYGDHQEGSHAVSYEDWIERADCFMKLMKVGQPTS